MTDHKYFPHLHMKWIKTHNQGPNEPNPLTTEPIEVGPLPMIFNNLIFL